MDVLNRANLREVGWRGDCVSVYTCICASVSSECRRSLNTPAGARRTELFGLHSLDNQQRGVGSSEPGPRGPCMDAHACEILNGREYRRVHAFVGA